jgi:formyltetrahydrofolate deformylase
MCSEEGNLGGKVVVAVGNHPDLEEVADRFAVPYYCLPTPRSGDPDQENALLELLKRHHIDLVVLARYMRVLSERVINAYPGRIINIHHAFLPAFQGGNPYLQAWERGVKMIGATAHYATVDLDEGPIIEQAVERITHESTPEDLRDLGRDIERRVLTRAVQFHLEHRVIVSGRRTVVFAK